MSNFKNLHGVLPVLHTPFDEQEEIDRPILHKEIAWLHGLGVDGVTTGMVTEILKLSPAERMSLHEIIAESSVPLGLITVLSAGAESTKQAIAYAKHAQSIQADAVMVNPPLSTSLSENDLYGYYAAIFNATDIPLIVQDASGYVGRPVSLELQVKLLNDFGSRIYFKPEAVPIGPRLSLFLEATNGQARVLEGSGGGALIDTHQRGVVGTMPGADNAWALVALWRALEAGNFDLADRISGPLVNIIALEFSLDAYLAIEKYFMRKQGIFINEIVRQPFGFRLDEKTKLRLDRLFDLLHASVYN
ncbi:MAG: dihydrodipicolinate synthase family protein [Actinobacteria bacterium]|nr:dihydrodipicolinate synthase family protein [Actinomycetota bacterium]